MRSFCNTAKMNQIKPIPAALIVSIAFLALLPAIGYATDDQEKFSPFTGGKQSEALHDGSGNHVITGNGGTDSFIFPLEFSGPTHDIIADFRLTADEQGEYEKIDLIDYIKLSQERTFTIELKQNGNDTEIILENRYFPEAIRKITIKSVLPADLTLDHFVLAPDRPTILKVRQP